MDRLGITATRNGITENQTDSFITLIKLGKPNEVHDGDCIGGDTEIHAIVRKEFPLCYMVGHPPTEEKHRAHNKYDMSFMPKPYLERDDHIIDVTDEMIALPKEMKEPKSKRGGGTWTVIRHTRKKGRKLTIIYPDGTMGE